MTIADQYVWVLATVPYLTSRELTTCARSRYRGRVVGAVCVMLAQYRLLTMPAVYVTSVTLTNANHTHVKHLDARDLGALSNPSKHVPRRQCRSQCESEIWRSIGLNVMFQMLRTKTDWLLDSLYRCTLHKVAFRLLIVQQINVFFRANLSKYDTSTKLGVNTPWGLLFWKNTLATWNLRWRPFFKMAAILAHNLHILLHNLTTVTDLGDIGVKK